MALESRRTYFQPEWQFRKNFHHRRTWFSRLSAHFYLMYPVCALAIFRNCQTDFRGFLHLCTLLYSNKQSIIHSISAGLHVCVTYLPYRTRYLRLGILFLILVAFGLILVCNESLPTCSSNLFVLSWTVLLNLAKPHIDLINHETYFWFCKDLSSGYTNNDLSLWFMRLYFTRTQNNCLLI